VPDCVKCGGYVTKTDERCSFCGSDNPAYEAISSDLDTLMAGAMGAMQTGNYTAAAKLYHQVIQTDPDISMAYFYLGHCLNQLRQYKEAIEAMKQGLALRPGSSALAYNIGVVAQSSGRDKEAREYLQKALDLTKSDPSLEDRREMESRIREAMRRLG